VISDSLAGSAASRRRTCVAEEEMVRLWVNKRLALDPHARLDVLEPGQLCVVPNIRSNLDEDQSARNKERAPHAMEEKHSQHPIRHNVIIPLRADPEGRRSCMVMCGNGLPGLCPPAPKTFCLATRQML
jgi:hypothetical protein